VGFVGEERTGFFDLGAGRVGEEERLRADRVVSTPQPLVLSQVRGG
jgi:hypothetical protein